jgi:hypothetical protein
MVPAGGESVSGSPWENRYVESVNSRSRDKLPNNKSTKVCYAQRTNQSQLPSDHCWVGHALNQAKSCIHPV